MKLRLSFFVAAFAAAFFGGGVAAAPADSSAPPFVSFDFALYFVPQPTADAEAELNRLLRETHRELHRLDSTEALMDGCTITSRWVPIDEYAPPGPDSFRYMAHGLEMADGAAMAQGERVFILTFTVPRAGANRANRLACALLADLADATGGNPWDEECRLVYSAKVWRESRVATWQGDVPDMMAQINMHAYRNPELLRIITLGLRKFGQPDLVMTDVANHSSRSAGNVINICAQLLVEGLQPKKRRLPVLLKAIRHTEVRGRALQNPLEGAKGRALVSLTSVEPEEGDPANTLWSIDFPEANAKSRTERQEVAFAKLFGATDKVTHVITGDLEMAAAKERARAAFFKQEAVFRRGLEPNERLLVKAPFGSGDEEYMWVEVTRWQEKAITGVLMNDPYYVKGLKSGMRVTVKLDDVYDYLHYRPDGSVEGNETGKVLEKREAGR